MDHSSTESHYVDLFQFMLYWTASAVRTEVVSEEQTPPHIQNVHACSIMNQKMQKTGVYLHPPDVLNIISIGQKISAVSDHASCDGSLMSIQIKTKRKGREVSLSVNQLRFYQARGSVQVVNCPSDIASLNGSVVPPVLCIIPGYAMDVVNCKNLT